MNIDNTNLCKTFGWRWMSRSRQERIKLRPCASGAPWNPAARLRRQEFSTKTKQRQATQVKNLRRCPAIWQSRLVCYRYIFSPYSEVDRCAAARILKINGASACGVSGHRRRRRGAGASTKIQQRAHLCKCEHTTCKEIINYNTK